MSADLRRLLATAQRPDRPRVEFRADVVDDRVARLTLPGGVVHDFPVVEALVLIAELQQVVAVAEQAVNRPSANGNRPQITLVSCVSDVSS